MKTFVLMTALPPTVGHLHLIQFASRLAMHDECHVILCTQPIEPMSYKRYYAIEAATRNLDNVTIHHMHKNIEQDPNAIGFWQMWYEIMTKYGCDYTDTIVASEVYGENVAEVVGCNFMPYDIGRTINHSRATDVRNDPFKNFRRIIPEFQNYIRPTVTIFGAESTGKTTLSMDLAFKTEGDKRFQWLFEYARPYLETVGPEISEKSMTDIWKGQRALQQSAYYLYDLPWVVQDTDLFSTVGYWDLWASGQAFPGTNPTSTPKELIANAKSLQSDLYLIPQSNIPFEADAIRYGGDKRESSDQFWIDLCRKHGLNYRMLLSKGRQARQIEALNVMNRFFKKNVVSKIAYDRKGL